MPNVFQGNPVRTCPRSHSVRLNPAARANRRPAPGVQSSRAIIKPKPGKTASTAGSPATPSGKAQAYSSASTRNAAPSHQRPATKKPKAHHQPTANARQAETGNPKRSRGPAGFWRVSAQPSMSQTATVIGMIKTGEKLKGAMASAPVAPAAKAMKRRRQPEARIIAVAIPGTTGALGLKSQSPHGPRILARNKGHAKERTSQQNPKLFNRKSLERVFGERDMISRHVVRESPCQAGSSGKGLSSSCFDRNRASDMRILTRLTRRGSASATSNSM